MNTMLRHPIFFITKYGYGNLVFVNDYAFIRLKTPNYSFYKMYSSSMLTLFIFTIFIFMYLFWCEVLPNDI